jgi:hypothetical protein
VGVPENGEGQQAYIVLKSGETMPEEEVPNSFGKSRKV